MKSSSEIRYDFKQSTKRAEELENMAASLHQLAEGELTSILSQLSMAWKGEAADNYLAKGDRLKERIIKSEKDLNRTAATIRSTAQRIYNAEMRAYRRAKERKYQQ